MTLLGGAAAWPQAARAQQAAMPLVGYLHSASPEPYAPMMAAFRQGLKETSYVEGQNVALNFAGQKADRNACQRSSASATSSLLNWSCCVNSFSLGSSEISRKYQSILITTPVCYSKYPPAEPGALVLEPLEAAYPCCTSQASHPLCGMPHASPTAEPLQPAVPAICAPLGVA
jgi:hypothetical protein